MLTWNVGEVYWPWHGNQLKDRDLAHVAAALRALAPDVVLLQEILHAGQIEQLAGDRYVGRMSERCGYDRHVGILLRADLGATFIDGLLEPTRRGVLSAHFRLAGVRVTVVSLHFDVFHPARRLLQARAAASLVGRHVTDLVVAGGDFNYDPGLSRRLGRQEDLEAESLMLDLLSDVAEDTGPTLIGLLRVDRLLVGGPALKSARSEVCPQRTPLGDHAPVLADLELVSELVDGDGEHS